MSEKEVAAMLAEALHNEVIGCKWDEVTEYKDCPGPAFHASDGRLLANSSKLVTAKLLGGVGAVRERIAAERRTEPWPQFGAYGDARQAARDGFNMALDVVDDILAAAQVSDDHA